MVTTKVENPWTIRSIYELQYFNCPTCLFKNPSKQEFVNHAYACHPEAIENLTSIEDGSLSDISCPWDSVQIKIESEPVQVESLEIDYKNEDQDYDFKYEQNDGDGFHFLSSKEDCQNLEDFETSQSIAIAEDETEENTNEQVKIVVEI